MVTNLALFEHMTLTIVKGCFIETSLSHKCKFPTMLFLIETTTFNPKTNLLIKYLMCWQAH